MAWGDSTGLLGFEGVKIELTLSKHLLHRLMLYPYVSYSLYEEWNISSCFRYSLRC